MAESKTFKELLQASCKDVECPDFGFLKIRPYVSAAGMNAFIRNKAEPTKALKAVLITAIEVDDAKSTFEKLSDEDKEVIVKELAESFDCLEQYNDLRQSERIAQAFYKTFLDSEAFASWLESNKRIEKILAKQLNIQYALRPFAASVVSREKVRFVSNNRSA